MALVSPGVEVNVIDESFYVPAAAGTTPMIFVASAENKPNSSGTGTARGTLKQNAGVPFLLTSQRDLSETFGDPTFETDNNNNPINGGELNEYGLQAAYSVLGVTNRAFVTRADIDLGALQPTAVEPAADPENGTFWLDTDASSYGVFQWNGSAANETNGQSFIAKEPILVTATSDFASGTQNTNGTDGNVPKGSIGVVGDYAIVFASTVVRLFYKNTQGTWVLVGSDAWTRSWPTIAGTSSVNLSADGSFEINDTVVSVTAGDSAETIANNINGLLIPGITASAVSARLNIFSDGTDSGVDSTASGSVTLGSFSSDDTNADLASELGLEAGTFFPPALQISKHTEVPRFKTGDTYTRPTGSVWIKTTEPGGGARWRMKVYNEAADIWNEVDAPLLESNADALFELDRTGGGAALPVGAVYVNYNVADDFNPLATFKVYRRADVAPTTVVGSTVTLEEAAPESYTVNIQATQPGQRDFTQSLPVTFDAGVDVSTTAENFATAVNAVGITGLSASVDANNRITLEHATGGDIKLIAMAMLLNRLGFSAFEDPNTGTANLYFAAGTDESTSPLQLQASLWKATENDLIQGEVAFYTASADEVTSLTENGTLWYNSVIDEVDLMIHDGTTWVGYKNFSVDYQDTDPLGPIVSASTPTSQSDGTDLVDGDIWIDTSNIEEYPGIYRFNTPVGKRWVELDTTDQTSEDGVLFADARWSTSGQDADQASIVELQNSDFLDFDAPDPALYPRGMILFNLRRSGFNVKRFVRDYVDTNQDNERFNDESMNNYYPHRWVTESANQNDGSGSFGRKAQRQVVIQALQATLFSNDDIRDAESRQFNLLASPGYPELIGEMITLNFDRGLTSFIIGDAPARLEPNATSLNNWATNERLAVEDSLEGLVSRDEYLGIFYPWGFTSDNFGNNVVVPPSHMIMRTMILSDQVSFPWFAPAGTRRGGITNASSVGYVDAEGEFNSIALNEGQRDVLYDNEVNPITFLSGAGLVNFGQKTRARGASALDRINVARLVIFLRGQLNQLAKPYIFEQNDKITRDEIKQQTESLLLELVGQRALNDFLVVCDESNNTPSRIDRNELYLDIAIEPIKAVEFIFIPLRLKNTGEIASI
jgi:hypothetical protein